MSDKPKGDRVGVLLSSDLPTKHIEFVGYGHLESTSQIPNPALAKVVIAFRSALKALKPGKPPTKLQKAAARAMVEALLSACDDPNTVIGSQGPHLKPSPKIRLDNGSVVWGCECWWGPETPVRHRLELAKADGWTIEQADLGAFRKAGREVALTRYRGELEAWKNPDSPRLIRPSGLTGPA